MLVLPSRAFDCTNDDAVTSEQRTQYANIIDDILRNADLTSISAKAVRKEMQDRLDHDITALKVSMQHVYRAGVDHHRDPLEALLGSASTAL